MDADHAVTDDHRANVDAVVRDRLLEVVDGTLDLERAEHPLRDVPVLDPCHPEAHRTEQGLDDDVGAELVERHERVPGALAGDGPRRGQAGGCQERRAEELVDRMLDGQRAVDGAHADGGQRVERVDAEDDLLERATWDRTHDHDVALVERHLARAHRNPSAIRPTMRVTGAKAHSCPRLVNARSSRSACQPPVEPMTAARMRANLAGRRARRSATPGGRPRSPQLSRRRTLGNVRCNSDARGEL